jgi:L-ribulose-5-phosphate 4-epimerase|tara:strand:- start:1298 stop:1984 length:687 start_codon:yes stop_codon:yes gene_type:complete
MKSDKQIIKNLVSLNKNIFKNNLTILNFGNASYLNRINQKLFIKGSGFNTEDVKTNNISVLKFKNNKFYPMNKIKPSVDTVIHFSVYSALSDINFVAHTHSTFATVLAQLEIEPDCAGTTHADFFHKTVPLSSKLKNYNNINYEKEIGNSIINRLKKEKYTPPGMLIRNHGLIAWGKSARETLDNLIAIEKICELYYLGKLLKKKKIPKKLHNLHFFRKHGKDKRYGQ